ncbi:STAS domain-containing protein [Bacillus sp. 31A1R]|uniref:STAS domain-containing protein n=1 Tax=Robertmurraya mangrovi TaxID=3098077 RepID=A0ABU5IWU3_9BACI|nr:STAS domain-containing protein [Bacillus sp. 31A1R]MDZ5471623.1 STAS domain-containing protein [Bacillus sp. 31A1R]
MHKNPKLYEYLLDHCSIITEKWISTLGYSSQSVYSRLAPSSVIEMLKEQNEHLIKMLSKVFIEEENVFKKDFRIWAKNVAEERVKTNTQLIEIIQQFKNFRLIFFQFIHQFINEHSKSVSTQEVLLWTDLVNHAFLEIIESFTITYTEITEKQLHAQQEVINELSSPVIPIAKGKGVLPLVGLIDSERAKFILQSTLEQCGDKKITEIYIDLSGVPVIDTMVAHDLFQLITALKFIGVKSTLSGMRPELAQTAVQLGIDFTEISIKSNLQKALSL